MTSTGTEVEEVAPVTSRPKKDPSTDPLPSSSPSSGQSEPLLYVGGSKECSEEGCTIRIPIDSHSGMCSACFSERIDDEPVGVFRFH